MVRKSHLRLKASGRYRDKDSGRNRVKDKEVSSQRENKDKNPEKEHNQCGFANIFNSNIDFECASTQNDYEEE